MLQIKGLGKAFRGDWLFRSLDFQINDRDRVGLVGDNGTGKSTLMKILAGLATADEGDAVGAKALTFGYLPQDGLFARGRRLLEETLTVFASLQAMQEEIRALEQELADLAPDAPEHEKKMERYAALSGEFQMREGYSLEAKAGAVLQGLGFSKDDMGRPCEDFSGGWQMRIALAKLLLQQPNLLLLDEPTNHLDLEARNWLEGYLQAYPHALMMVSHDRYFLDATVDRIMEIRNRTVHFYRGNYEDFTRQQKERVAQLHAAYEAQQKEIARINAFADRFRYKATKAAQVQSRLKELERMERIEIPPEAKPMRLRFPEGPRTGRTVLELDDVSAGYGGTMVFRDMGFILEKGDRVALVGPNGAGKSTLMKVLAGRLPLAKGERREGRNVIVSYFSQDQDDLLSSTKTVWDEVYSVAPSHVVPQLRTMLGCFLFSGDAIEKPVGVLSGGERSRLVLCKLLFSPANCLLLDEPTNHLDIKSKDILMDALGDYGGTLVFVSHDRYFLDGLATKVLEIGGGTATAYVGNYEDYLRKKAVEDGGGAAATSTTATPAPPTAASAAPTPPEPRKKKVNPYKIKQVADQIAKVEGEIQLHETRIAVLNQMLASEELYRDRQLFRNTMDEHDRLEKDLSVRMGEWERLNADLEALQG
ncbi:MAG: ATP-binding cassette domain-containing protein [Acidobacteriota bacterium]|jgi:ATP-binding cassette subfamily F protein 3|nr:ATP-binding cassette domain-containing protein [Acidobacteriota bacterium]